MSKAPSESEKQAPQRFVKVHELKPEDYESGCLRPLGLCELGGCCDVCFYGKQSARKSDKDGKS